MQLHAELAGGLVRQRLCIIPLLLQPRRQRRDLERLLRHARLQHIAFRAHLLRASARVTCEWVVSVDGEGL